MFIIFLAVIFLLPDISHAQNDVYGINDLTNANLGTRDLRETITGIINIALGFLGILATIIILYGGFIWMTSSGASDKIDRAKKIIISGVIGLLIVLSSYAIARFVFGQYYGGIFGGGPGGPGGPGYNGGIGLGAGVLESHYPARNAVDIPRNTNIYVTFKEPIDLDSFISNSCNGHPGYSQCVNDTHIRLINEENNEILDGSDLMVAYDADHKIFEFNPYGNDTGNDDYLGSEGTNTVYQMVLDGLRTQNDQPAFTNGFYEWRFTVGSVLDLTPPTVTSVIPTDGSINNPRNSSVQINFSEGVNPIFAAGNTADGFQNIRLESGGVINGEYLISNQYQTVSFVTEEQCGTNSCGGNVYCLPGGANISGTVTTAIRDMAGNQLASDYNWGFTTNDTIDLTPPVISDMSLATGSQFDLEEPLRVTFSKDLLSNSINSDNIYFDENINFWLSLQNNRTVIISHDRFDILENYTPNMTSGIQDSLQNCWYPCACDDPGGSCECNQDNSGTCAAGTHCQTNN